MCSLRGGIFSSGEAEIGAAVFGSFLEEVVCRVTEF